MRYLTAVLSAVLAAAFVYFAVVSVSASSAPAGGAERSAPQSGGESAVSPADR